jgi:CheY-like chemotaxis protein
MNSERPQKPKMLVVDDEPDNLDLLYRTFRRDFNVLRAESGITALEILSTEGEVAVIISDQRMPEMKGTEFLSKTVPQFPDTMRIILTGFTDVEDLVEAINSGQVYKYITKPWDPHELKGVVQRAAETYDLLKQRTEELHQAQAQTTLLSLIIAAVAQAAHKDDCLKPIADACGKALGADRCVVQRVEGKSVEGESVEGSLGVQGVYGSESEGLGQPLDQDPLVEAAIATHQLQSSVQKLSVPNDLEPRLHPGDSDIRAHIVAPVVFKHQVVAVLSLQWSKPHLVQADKLMLINLATQQIGMAIACA